jgi:hypothetical protein
MKTLGPSALALGIALSLDTGACSSTGASGSAALDAGSREGGFEGGGSSDAASALDTALSDASVDGARDDAGCGLPRTGRGGACDDCVETNCEPAWCSCAGESPPPVGADAGADDAEAAMADDAMADDAGSADAADSAASGAGCLGYEKCVVECVADDAGSPTDCFEMVCAVAAYPLAEQQAGHAFLDCQVLYCASECGQ